MAGVVHISEEEAAKNFGAIMKHVRSGDEVFVAGLDGIEAVVMRAHGNQPVKTLSSIAITEEREATPELSILDDDFFADGAEVHEGRKAPQKEPTFQRRTIAEAIEILRLREKIQGLAIPDPDMASDMEEINALYNQPMDMSRWD